MVTFFAIYGILSVAATIAALLIAPRRGRDAQVWAFWSFFFPPTFGLLMLLPRGKTGSAPQVVIQTPDDDDRDDPVRAVLGGRRD